MPDENQGTFFFYPHYDKEAALGTPVKICSFTWKSKTESAMVKVPDNTGSSMEVGRHIHVLPMEITFSQCQLIKHTNRTNRTLIRYIMKEQQNNPLFVQAGNLFGPIVISSFTSTESNSQTEALFDLRLYYYSY